MPQKRTTPEDDIDRLAERVWQRGRGKIRNRDDFDAVFDSYLTQGGKGLTKQQRLDLRDSTFSKIQKRHSGVSSERGKDTSQRKELFASAGRVPSREEYVHPGKVGKRTAFLRRTIITFKKSGKQRTVYRDSKGHFGRMLSGSQLESKPGVASRPATYDPGSGKYV